MKTKAQEFAHEGDLEHYNVISKMKAQYGY
jgi:hypothetical protein